MKEHQNAADIALCNIFDARNRLANGPVSQSNYGNNEIHSPIGVSILTAHSPIAPDLMPGVVYASAISHK